MKSIVKTLIAASLSIAAVSACSEEKLSPSTTGARTTVHFGATSSIVDNTTKATLTSDDDNRFIGAWENGDEIGIQYTYVSLDMNETTSGTWDKSKSEFSAEIVDMSEGEEVLEMKYNASYPYSKDGYVDFGSNRTQVGASYNSKYDLMVSEPVTVTAKPGVDAEGKAIVFPMQRQTAIAYFHLTSDNTEAVTKATLKVEGENAAIAAETVVLEPTGMTHENGLQEIVLTTTDQTADDFKLWFNVLPTSYTKMSLTIETATKTLTINNTTPGKYDAEHLYKVKGTLSADKWVENDPSFKLLTNASNLQIGQYIVIAANKFDYAISTKQNTNNRGQSKIKKSQDLSSISLSEDTQVFIVEAGSTTGTYAFKVFNADNNGGYIYAASSSANNLKTQTKIDANASWTVTVNNNVATIKANGSNKKNLIRYNDSNKLFSCYDSGQRDVCVYYTIVKPTIKSAATISFGNSEIQDGETDLMIGKSISLEATTNSTAELTYSSDKPEVASVDASGVITAKSEGTAVITVSVAENDEYYAAEKEITVNVVGKYEQEITYTDVSKILVAGSTLNLEAKAKGELSYSSDDEKVATISNDGIVKAVAEGKAVITISAAETEEYKAATATVEITVRPEGTQTKYFVKVTEAPTDWSGTYLIVYEAGNVAFDGSLTTLDASNNTVKVTITDNKIEESDILLKSTFEIAKIGETTNYSLKSASGYYTGYIGNKNGMNTDQKTVYDNAISFSNGAIEIASGTASSKLNFNKTSGQNRFRYYKSGQESIQLYRLED